MTTAHNTTKPLTSSAESKPQAEQHTNNIVSDMRTKWQTAYN